MGYDVEVIDYRCDAIEKSYPPIRFSKLRKNMYQWCIDSINYMRYGNVWKDKAGKFELFRTLFQMSSSYYDMASKNKVEKEFDYIITGSDQIWSVDTLNKKIDYWYCYKKESSHPVKVVSYAASAGSLSRFKETFCEFEPVLSEYDALSVREDGVQDFLEEKLQRKVHTVVDPTLLVDKQLWLQLIEGSANRSDNYLVYYDVAQNNLSRKIAKAIANYNRYSVVKFNQIKSPTHKTELLNEAGPIDFLNSVYNASCVVTSSFHATVFSILFHKQFVVALHPVTGERVKSLLTKLGQEAVIFSLLEKKTENHIAIRIPGKTIEEVRGAMQMLREEYGEQFSQVFKTITVDNGSEFADFAQVEAWGTKVHFAHPYSSWERPQNERHNGLIRAYVPEGESIEQ